MADRKIGVSLALDGEKKFKDGIRSVDQELRVFESQMKAVTSGYDKQSASAEELAKVDSVLSNQIQTLRNKQKMLNEAIETAGAAYEKAAKKAEEMADKHGKNSKEAEDAYRAMIKAEKSLRGYEIQANNTTRQLNTLERQQRDLNSSTEKAKISFGGFERGLRGIGTAAKATGAVLASMVVGIGTLTAAALQGYAETEQLVGGVDTLFKTSSAQVQEYANNAYQTAGLSANRYMENVTNFSASLIESIAQKSGQLAETTTAATEESIEKQKEVLIRGNEEKLQLIQESHEQEISDFEELTDQKIELINKQYRESLKNIDAEKYEKLKAIDEQIDKLRGLTQAEREEVEKREVAERRANLEASVERAKTFEEREKLENDLRKFDEAQNLKSLQKKRQVEIDKLNAEKETIRAAADLKKEAEKEKYAEQLEIVKENSEKELSELKKAQKNRLQAIKDANQLELTEFKKHQDEMLNASTSAAIYSEETYKKAAESANMAITDMSDNANKFGTDMASLEHAYGGFAKGNFTMLDNLKLGFGGTKEEMQRLLEKAESLSGIEYDIGSFDDIVHAIHVVQTELDISGITAEEAAELVASGAKTEEEAFEMMGTTAKEAKTTIQGSLAATQGAFKNLISNLANDEADFEKLIDNAVDSTITTSENILPRIETILEGTADLIDGLSPVLGEKFPEMFNDLLPRFVELTFNVIDSMVQGFKDNNEEIAESAVEIVDTLVDGVLDLTPDIVDVGLDLIIALAKGLGDNLPELTPAAYEAIYEICDALAENTDDLIDAGLTLMGGLGEGVVKSAPVVAEKAPEVIQKLVDEFQENHEEIIDTGVDMAIAIGDGIIQAIPDIVAMIPEFTLAIKDAIIETDWLEIGGEIIDGIGKGIKEGAKNIGSSIKETVGGIGEGFEKVWDFGDKNVDIKPAQNFGGVSPSAGFKTSGDTYQINIDSKNVKEFNDIISVCENAKQGHRAGSRSF